MMIKVAVFDDNAQVRESLEMLIEGQDDMELVGAFEDAIDAEKYVERIPPDVVLMDIDMPGVNGITAVSRLKKRWPAMQIVMLTVFEDEDRVYDSLCAGAVGYMLKNTDPQRLVFAIKEAFEGGAPMTPTIARKVLNHFQVNKYDPDQAKDYHLTEREKEALRYLVDGLSYKMIADKMGIGFETVRSHIKNIYEKLHVSSSTEAVSKAIQQRLIK